MSQIYMILGGIPKHFGKFLKVLEYVVINSKNPKLDPYSSNGHGLLNLPHSQKNNINVTARQPSGGRDIAIETA